MASLIDQLLHKMGLADEDNVLSKTTELLRLLDLRSVNMPLQINEYGKIVLCADIAAGLLAVAIDKEQALKLSGLRKTQYTNNKRMFEKLLDVHRQLSVRDICLQLGASELCMKSQELLDHYRRVMASQGADLDIANPQYAAMAVFQAARLLKRRIAKPKIMPFSHLRPTQWQDLEQRWTMFLDKHYKEGRFTDTTNKPTAAKEVDPLALDNESQKPAKDDRLAGKTAPAVEDYETWKKRMLSMAECQLRLQRLQVDKENIIR